MRDRRFGRLRDAGTIDFETDVIGTGTLEILSVELELPLPQEGIFDQLGTRPGVVIYYAKAADFADMPGRELLTPERRERIRGFKQEDDKVRSLVAGLLLRRFVSPKEPLRGQYGKPFFRDGPFFNLSHAGDYVVLAVAGGDVGVDIERLRPWQEKVAERCFAGPERDWLARQIDPLNGFYRLWTAKESVMKASGEGFHMPPETVRVFPRDAAAQDANGADWYLSWFELPGHVICVATPSAQGETTLQQVSREELLESPEEDA